MKLSRILKVLLCTLILLAAVAPVAASTAQTYTITTYTIDGGGEMYSDDGRFALGGTIGQPDATVQQGEERFVLTGGFWGVSLLDDGDKTLFLPYLNR